VGFVSTGSKTSNLGTVRQRCRRMTLAYLTSRQALGARIEKDEVGYRLQWPEVTRAVFNPTEVAGAQLLTLEDPHVHGNSQ
jgi:hypothetical protein